MWWDEAGLASVVACMAAVLSILMDVLLMLDMLRNGSKQRVSANPSPSYTLCSFADPTLNLRVFTLLSPLYMTAAAPIPPSMPDPSPYALTSLLSILSMAIASCIVSAISTVTFDFQYGGNLTALMVSSASGCTSKSLASS